MGPDAELAKPGKVAAKPKSLQVVLIYSHVGRSILAVTGLDCPQIFQDGQQKFGDPQTSVYRKWGASRIVSLLDQANCGKSIPLIQK